VNPSHDLVRNLHALRTRDPQLAELVAIQLFDNAMVEAGLADDPRKFVGRINKILNLALKQEQS
jgi:TNF receptor-associated protein 1